MSLLQTTIKVSSLSSFDQLITNYDNPRTRVTFTSDIGIKMEVDIKLDKENDVLIHNDFYYNNTKMHYGKLESRQLGFLLTAYRKYVTQVASERSTISLSWSLLKDPKSLAKVFTKVTKIKKVLQRYKDIRSINVFTILLDESARHPQQDYVLARTALELDADIITIIQPELLLSTRTDFLINLHSTNVRLANYLFLYPLTKIFSVVKLVKNMLRILSIPLWIALSLMIFPRSIINEHIINEHIFSIINFIVVPALLFKLVPRIMGHIIRNKLA